MKATSKWWYARISVQGKLCRFPLMEQRAGNLERIEIKGKRPASLRNFNEGDAAFRASYHRALAAHDRLVHEEIGKKNIEDLTQRLLYAKTGSRLDFVKVAALPGAWAVLPRKRKPGEQHAKTVTKKLQRFAEFIHKHHPQTEDLASVQSEQVRAFMAAEEKRGISGRTWNISLSLLKSVFRRLAPSSDAYREFLKHALSREEETVHRQPFTDAEIEAILHAAREDPVMRGPIATGICTAMRRGDCCLLTWDAVDLEAGFIEIKTSKTGERAEIPLLPALREELERARAGTGASGLVWPEAAAFYRDSPQKIDKRLRAILKTAGFVDDDAPAAEGGERSPLPELPIEELRARGLEAISRANMITVKRARMKRAFLAYLEKKTVPAIAREMGISKSSVSVYLNDIESLTGVAVIRNRPAERTKGQNPSRGNIHAKGLPGGRLKRASVRGWHSFRVAFCTRALGAGMPEELVRRVTGHTAVEVVRRHYFRPGREEFRREFEKAQPGFLMNGAKSRDEQLREVLEGMTAETWQKDQTRAIKLLNEEK